MFTNAVGCVCVQEGCGEAILAAGDKPFRRLEHFRMHDYARRLTLAAPGSGGPIGVAAVTSVDAMFKRKRGRPPKNRVIEVRYLALPPYHCNVWPRQEQFAALPSFIHTISVKTGPQWTHWTFQSFNLIELYFKRWHQCIRTSV